MKVEIRPARPEEMDEFRRVAGTALVTPEEELRGLHPEWTLCAFEDGKLATSYGAWPLTMRFNGEGVAVSGVTMVGTLPIYRRRGYLRKVITTHLRLLHEHGEQSVAILYASMAAIYQRYGYAVVSTQNAYRIEPRFLEFTQRQPIDGAFRELGDDEFGLLVDLYRRFRAERNGYLHRGRAMWEAGVLSPAPANGLLSKLVYEEDGQQLGYVIYTVEPQVRAIPGPNQLLRVRDVVWLTPSAYRAIWSYFNRMDLVADVVYERVPSDDPLPHLIIEPRMLNCTSRDGILARIVDVERCLPKRAYDVKGTLTFEIHDDLCPWNSGRWRLETGREGVSISRTAEDPQLRMPVSTLAMLVFGQISASDAARMDRLTVFDPNVLALWDIIMRTRYKPHCADHF